MFVHAIPQVTPERRGIHVLWAGPRAWLYSPAGWSIQRRVFERAPPRLDCVRLSDAELDRLRTRHELAIRHGALTLRRGPWLAPVAAAAAPAVAAPPTADVITLTLGATQTFVRVEVASQASFALALRDGKAVAGGVVLSGSAAHQLSAPEIDTVVVYVLDLKSFGVCVQPDDLAGWREVPVVKRLQLPIRELMPALATPDLEFAEASSRLLPGETLNRQEFEALTDVLRLLVNADGPPRPIDLALLMRETSDEDPQELCALDPIRVALIHPRWRRILGFAWFDDDASLIPGAVYEYRVTGGFPAIDLDHRVAGLHTVPSQTALPSEWYLGGVRLRFPQPCVVELAQPDTGARRQITRRGVRLAPKDQPWWTVPSIEDWSLVVDFPDAVSSVTLDLEPGHDLKFAAGAAWLPPSATAPLPPGPRARIDFATPIHQLLLTGQGFLESIRTPTGTIPLTPEVRPVSALTGPMPLVDAPLPDPPLFATVANLQRAQPVLTIDLPTTPPPHPHELGFEVRWRPAPRAGVGAWAPDLTAPPLLDAALFQVEHRQVAPVTTPFTPVIDAEDNITLGDRSYGMETPPIHPGVDLLTVFPEVRPAAAGATDLFWRDVFDFTGDGSGSADLPRPLPPPGTRHQYRVRAVDPIGRPSATWTETGNERLEKHTPPPLPAAPDLTSADALPEPAVTGVQARVLVAGAPDLTADEQTTLGTHTSAIVLSWGWHEEQRKQDKFAREFRIYQSTRAPGRVRATILGVVPLGGDRFDAAIQGDRAFAADAARRTVIEAAAQFRVLTHGPGPTATLTLRALERDASAQPIAPLPGPIELPIRITPDQTRASFWGARVAIEPIDARTVYTHTFFDLFDLSPDHPRDVIHVGVSAADREDYVPDPLAPAFTRPGNESPIVPVRCEGRWQGRPVVVEAPSLAPVPVIVTPEPGARPLIFTLDLTPHAPFPPAARVRPERVSDDAVFRAYRVENDRVIALVGDEPAPGDTEQDVTVPNAADRAAVLAALASGAVSSLEDRFVVFLASVHPHRARLFQAATREPVRLDQFKETLPNRGARWVYRLRLADAAGRLSAGAPTLPVIVRVPATTALAAPMRAERHPSHVVLRVAVTSEVTDLLVFTRALESQAASREDAELLRVASASGPAASRVRLRLPDGTLVAPTVKSLADADVVSDGSYRLVTVEAPGNALVRIWACAATRDGVISAPGGPWRVGQVTP
jgi:hypothetical protein